MTTASEAAPHGPDTRTAGDIGRRSRLELTFSRRGDRTVLSHAYAEPPFRVGKCLESNGAAHLIIASSAPGVFGGDCFDQLVVVEHGARVSLTSQSSLQVHPEPSRADALVASRYQIGAGATLVCEWHPLIPFAGSRCRQRIAIDADPDSELFWSDALMAGREARGERWRFASLAHELRLSIGGRLSYLERYVIEPACDPPDTAWRGGGACYFGTVLALSRDVDRESVEAVHHALQAHAVHAAADLIEQRLMLVRLMGAAGPPFHAARERVAMMRPT